MDRKWFRSRRWGLSVCALASLLAAGCGDDVTETCEYGGKTHEIGDLFPSSDGCNMCGCEAGGEVECTTKACSSGEGCDDEGITRKEGERWSTEQGCRSCICNANGTITCTTAPCEISCSYNGQRYLAGTSFPATDGCNTCTCSPKGEVACTQRACAPTGACEYGNQFYPVGASFPATDGCNKCTCAADRMVSCTTIGCNRCMYNGRYYEEGQEFVTTDGCTRCTCGANGGSECSDADCPEGCHFGAGWFEPGDQVICPDGCNTCRCDDALQWRSTPGAPDCRQRYAELCAAGPGANRVEAKVIYFEIDTLALETPEGCEGSYLLCFNPQDVSAQPLPVDVWLVQLEAACEDAELRTQFSFNLATIRDDIWTRLATKTPVVTLQIGSEQVDYPL